jgi:hypothetical protein
LKKKNVIIVSIVMMLLLFLAPLNIYAISQENSESYNYSFSQKINDSLGDPPSIKFPGEIIDDAPMFKHFSIPQHESYHHKISTRFSSDLIIDIITQLNQTLYLKYLEDIVEFGPRRTGTPACKEAGIYIYNQFKAMGIEARYHNWSYGGNSGSVIEGTLKGINETSDEIYIICAHYDSVAGSPGADDDGSGTAAVLVAADLLSRNAVNHTVKFVAFDGEEQGLLGSHEYAREASQNGDNIIGVLNGDMIGFAITKFDGSNIKIFENSQSHWITTFTDNISDIYYEYIGLNIIPSGSSGGSDHYSFWQYGYDAIFYHEYNFNDYYHSPEDTIEHMNLSYATNCSRLMVATLAELAQAVIPSQPPNKPIITGPKTGIEGEELEFTFVTTDPEGEEVYYYIEWGDDNNSGWIGPYNSGEEVKVTHIWDVEGYYSIKALAKDGYDVKSNWSIPFQIQILGGPFLDIRSINGGLFRVNSIIKNIGGLDAENVNWEIILDGGAIIGKKTNGTVNIPAGSNETIISRFIFGFGPTRIKVRAWLTDNSDTKEIGGYVALFYVRVNPGG